MRLPLRHPPPSAPSPRQRCEHLALLAEAARGLPLGPAARALSGARGRGRHGNALQWHLGLEPHDSVPEPDWEGRIEIKLISVWQLADGRLGCDRIKVCEVGVDPWHKLSNVLFVFADRLTRVVLGHRFFHLGAASLDALARSWTLDPHFGRPDLMVESREGPEGMSPAYYLSRRWLSQEGLLPTEPVRFGYRFDANWWRSVRAEFAGRDPLLTLARVDHGEQAPCPRCRGTLRADLSRVFEVGWAPATHAMPLGERCALRGHALIDPRRLPEPAACSDEEQFLAVEGALPEHRIWRLADRVREPEDHGH
ncbi:hypothetical protein G6O69_32265 [Pseudenhygromyxa sp. WMMC2535]|uniref:hypothetical protein n=1 Tax=Pseudenhygromyxa sp. WMMC2535 TaxID=2712867 RepID=UPI001595944A|nr:hypothetical protein [Pseudenhygromyxa sp. WMMC2535]NVB42543.1 hypothetical protein [Pseudenhygromyxa sp. WMMC2535]